MPDLESLDVTLHCVPAFCSPLFEIALVLVRFDYVASVIVNANHGIKQAYKVTPDGKIRLRLTLQDSHSRRINDDILG